MKSKLIKKSVVFMNRMLSDVIHIYLLIVIYFVIGKQKLVVRHRALTMKAGGAVQSSVLIEKYVSMKLSVQSLNNLNKCAFVNQVFF